MATSLLVRPFVGGAALISRPAQSVRSRAQVTVAASRATWLPELQPPAHLEGKLAGDFGFDPLGLGSDPERLTWFAEAEKTNGRWAMAAVAGILGQELLGRGHWFEAGALDYAIPTTPLLALEFLIVGFFELKRYQGWKATGTSGVLDSFPFDPLGQNSDSMALKEVKNGRLAMIAFVGFCVQALVTRQGPIENLTAHLSAPFSNNIIGSIASLPQTLGK